MYYYTRYVVDSPAGGKPVTLMKEPSSGCCLMWTPWFYFDIPLEWEVGLGEKRQDRFSSIERYHLTKSNRTILLHTCWYRRLISHYSDGGTGGVGHWQRRERWLESKHLERDLGRVHDLPEVKPVAQILIGRQWPSQNSFLITMTFTRLFPHNSVLPFW